MSVVIFKPDEIGDFVIATGAMRLLAEKHGEENTTIVVKSELVSLARREFPGANIVGVPWQARRKGRNQAFANIRHCYPTWKQLRGLRVDVSVCLRSARKYVQTLLFVAPRAKRRVAAENVLLHNGSLRRRLLESALASAWRVEILPYPASPCELTCELASHRLVTEAALRRSVDPLEIRPRLVSAPWRGSNGWLLCPFSSRTIKDYNAERWLEAMRQVSVTPKVVRLAGAPDQAARLQDFAAVLRAGSLACPVEVVPPVSLGDFADLVAGADLVLTVDTAAAHFACAVDAPAVIVDSGNNPGVYGPHGRPERQVWLVGDRKKFGRLRWQETVPASRVAAAIEQASAA